jgi:hypothetical protein
MIAPHAQKTLRSGCSAAKFGRIKSMTGITGNNSGASWQLFF